MNGFFTTIMNLFLILILFDIWDFRLWRAKLFFDLIEGSTPSARDKNSQLYSFSFAYFFDFSGSGLNGWKQFK
tara:strand:- start:204 stop:422 length:219 start_codon:yes stop_codon:yes gene_type:complete